MLEHLAQRGIALRWIGDAPQHGKDMAMLIPQFNEGSKDGFECRLAYFDSFARKYQDSIDVVLIDDGSTDASMHKINAYQKANDTKLYIASISPNAQKVGALFKTILNVDHPYIILSDFDTDIKGIEELLVNAVMLKRDPDLMGCYFKMVPFEGTGNVFAFQQLEYALQRSIYSFHKREGSVRVMPGAASCYKRKALLSIYSAHSGLRNGEDREATLLGLKMKYKTMYLDSVLAMTRPPLSFSALVNQRIRWNLGYFETFDKERDYYLKQIGKLNRFGIVTLVDMLVVVFILCLPALFLLIGLTADARELMLFSMVIYLVYIIWAARVLFDPAEQAGKKMFSHIGSLVIFPLFKIALDFCSWGGALLKFVRIRKSRISIPKEVEAV